LTRKIFKTDIILGRILFFQVLTCKIAETNILLAQISEKIMSNLSKYYWYYDFDFIFLPNKISKTHNTSNLEKNVGENHLQIHGEKNDCMYIRNVFFVIYFNILNTRNSQNQYYFCSNLRENKNDFD
jgi:hypothetical protein